jgi:hypothetical protein
MRTMNSSRPNCTRALAVRDFDRRVGQFLLEMLNLNPENRAGWKKFLSRFEDLLPEKFKQISQQVSEWQADADFSRKLGHPLRTDGIDELQPDFFERKAAELLPVLRRDLAQAWVQPTESARRVAILLVVARYIYLASAAKWPREVWQFYLVVFDESLPELPPNPLEDRYLLVLMRALSIAKRMRYCRNLECPAPYFLADRQTQKYCSPTCSEPAQREFKKRWWKEHGSKWRSARNRRALRSYP